MTDLLNPPKPAPTTIGNFSMSNEVKHTKPSRELASDLTDGWDFGQRFSIAVDYGEECVNAGINICQHRITSLEQQLGDALDDAKSAHIVRDALNVQCNELELALKDRRCLGCDMLLVPTPLNQQASSKITELERQNRELREYVMHKNECERMLYPLRLPDCTCGLDKALGQGGE